MTTTKNRAPTHRLYSVHGEGKAASWREIGAAWSNHDGQGYSLNLDAIPLSGRIVMRENTAQSEAGGQS